MKFNLVEAKSWSEYREDLLTHYAGSKGVFGRSIFYGIFDENNKKIGVIGAQSVVMPMKEVAFRVFGSEKVTSEIRKRYLMEVINNDIFRLYVSEPNLASQILAVWVKLLRKRWEEKYHTKVKAIISLTFGVNEQGIERTGECYKAANWLYAGKSAGWKRHTSGFNHEGDTYEKVDPKHVWIWKYDRNAKASNGEAPVVQSSIPGFQSGDHGVASDAGAPITSKFRMEIRGGKVVRVRIAP